MNIQTLSAVFEPGDRPYTFMVPDKLAAGLQPGEPVVVDTTAGLRIAFVEQVHGCDKRDPKLVTQGIKFKWAFARLPDDWRAYLEELKAFEDLMD